MKKKISDDALAADERLAMERKDLAEEKDRTSQKLKEQEQQLEKKVAAGAKQLEEGWASLKQKSEND